MTPIASLPLYSDGMVEVYTIAAGSTVTNHVPMFVRAAESSSRQSTSSSLISVASTKSKHFSVSVHPNTPSTTSLLTVLTSVSSSVFTSPQTNPYINGSYAPTDSSFASTEIGLVLAIVLGIVVIILWLFACFGSSRKKIPVRHPLNSSMAAPRANSITDVAELHGQSAVQ